MKILVELKFLAMGLATIFLATGIVADAKAAEIFYIQRADEPVDEGDEAQIDFLEGLGHSLDVWSNDSAAADPEAALEAADDADVVWINESVSSSRVGYIEETTTPMINNENFACDTLGWGDFGREGEGHGSPGTIRDNVEDGEEIIAGTHFGTDIEIIDDSHPIIQLSGLQNGVYTIYDDQDLGEEGGGRMSWCSPQEGTGANLAVMPEFKESHPEASVLSVYESGEEMGDGREAPGMRISMFLSNTNRGPAPEDDPTGGADGTGPGWEATILTDAGTALLRGALDYALGVSPDPTIRLDDGSLTDPAERVNYVHDVLGTWMGDSDLDGQFNSGDFVQVFGAAKYEVDEAAVWSEGDWNGDSRFNSADFVTAFSDGGYEKGPYNAAQVVPEPSSAVLLLGALALCAIRRKRR
ncbi:MAG: PEP-CTERM sorting domain-containing protein [Pirellulaceae bacterium]|nr:PEP-CTERM sorting domain-containing protein [Pirellulaceae bacterium]